MQRKRSEGIYGKLFTAITSGEWDGGGSVVVCILGMYCAFISVLFEFFISMYYFCNKKFF